MNTIPLSLLRQFVHDLRNPLNAVTGTVDMFQEGILGELTPPQVRALDRLARNNQRILYLLDDFMIFAKASAQELPLRVQPFSPRQLLYQVGDSLESHLRAKNLRFQAEFSPSFPAFLLGDAVYVEKIMAALLWNALEATEQGGLTLKNTWLEGWQLDIWDSGRGIPPENHAQIFDPFWQAEPKPQLSPSSRFGLGLAVSRALAEGMGGALTLAESDSTGSHFRLFLALKPTDTE